MSPYAWREGYDEVIAALTEHRDVRPCPYIKGSQAEILWEDGVADAWADEFRDQSDAGLDL